jgi:CRP-like cAMP-binding protein
VTPDDLAILEADSWFGAIPPDRRALLLAEAQVRSIAPGARLYSIGDAPNGLWALLEGRIRLKFYPAAGLELLALDFQPGVWFGEVSALDGLPRANDAIAFGPARVLHLSMAAFARATAAEPLLYRDLGLLVCRHQREVGGFIAQTVANPVGVRLALLLAGSAQDGRGVLKIRQEDLAVLVGVSRQTLNRHLKAFERKGILDLAYAETTIRDLPRLLAETR